VNPLTAAGQDALQRFGDRDVVHARGRWHSSGELEAQAARWAAGLAGLGVRSGDRVLVLMPNAPEVGVSYSAVWRVGGVVVPVLFVAGPADLAHAVRDSGARVAITVPLLLTRLLEAAGDALEHVVFVGEPGADADPRVLGEAGLTGEVPIADGDAGTLAALLYTGGTTGRAKGVCLSHGNLVAAAGAAVEAAHVPGVVRSLAVLPLAHVYGLTLSVAALLVPEPTTSVVLPWFVAADAITAIEEHRLQSMPVVPSMLALLLAEGLAGRDLSSLTHVGSGGAPLPDELARAFTAAVPHVVLREGYGATETCAICAVTRPDQVVLGSVGTAAPGYSLRIADDDDRPLPAGEVGEVLVQGPGVTAGYWHDPEATAVALRGGWLHTGDLGTLDADGRLRIVDRKKDLIIRGGFNVYPRDVEDQLLEHPDVTAAAVIGRPHPMQGEEVVAVVSLRPGSTVTPEDLLAWARERMSAAKRPREVRIVDAVPLTGVGKTDRKAVRAAVLG